MTHALQRDGPGPVLQQSPTGLGAETLSCCRMENRPLSVTTLSELDLSVLLSLESELFPSASCTDRLTPPSSRTVVRHVPARSVSACRGRRDAADEQPGQRGVRGGGGVTGHRLSERLLPGQSAAEPGGAGRSSGARSRATPRTESPGAAELRTRLRSRLSTLPPPLSGRRPAARTVTEFRGKWRRSEGAPAA